MSDTKIKPATKCDSKKNPNLEHKGYQTNNESRDLALSNLYRMFDHMNKFDMESGDSGDIAEENIMNKYDVAAISELSTATLLSEYEKLM